jgi:flavin reductase (DIM6/NTAB) family NADH-FMN oxidoreductase RutF/DNA-binding IclR family transcriptional regulator
VTSDPEQVREVFDAAWFRQVLGNFPTGVAVVTAMGTDKAPAGMAVGSFTSVSLDPPLVAFFPDRSSTSWPRIQAAGSFCVNILGADQETVCRTFAVRGGDKFAELSWRPAGSGAPILDGVVAWIDCTLEAVHPGGDHWIVLGRVTALDVARDALPLVFFQGGYGRFAPLSLAAFEGDLAVQLRSADLARPHMEALAGELGVECVASAAVGEELVLVANARATESRELPTRVGQRIPFLPPLGTAFVAWAPETARRAWLGRLGRDLSPDVAAALETTLKSVRVHGYSVGRGPGWHTSLRRALVRADPDDRTQPEARSLVRALPPDYEAPDAPAATFAAGGPDGPADEVRTLSAPVFGPDATVVLVLTVVRPDGRWETAAGDPAERLRAAAAAVTVALCGVAPA